MLKYFDPTENVGNSIKHQDDNMIFIFANDVVDPTWANLPGITYKSFKENSKNLIGNVDPCIKQAFTIPRSHLSEQWAAFKYWLKVDALVMLVVVVLWVVRGVIFF